MPLLTFQYPGDLPAFLREHAAPREWQERVQQVDRDLWVAWNPHHLDGARWCIMRWHGLPRGEGGAVLIERQEGDGVLGAMERGWSFVKSMETPDDAPCGLCDHIIGWLRREDYRRRYGVDPEGSLKAMEKEDKALVDGRQAAHDGLMADAFQDMSRDHTLRNNRTGVIMPTRVESGA